MAGRSKRQHWLAAAALALAPLLDAQAASDLWSWGYNLRGELGNGSTSNSAIPAPLAYPDGDVVAVAAGASHGLALRSDGSVLSWGWNAFGQLGNGSLDDAALPAPAYARDVIAVAGGAYHSLALRIDGRIWAWGSNQYGQLGDGGAEGVGSYSTGPVDVLVPDGQVAIAAGEDHSLSLDKDGNVWAWGDNFHGELGDGSTASRNYGQRVMDLRAVTAIGAGGQYSLALKADGTVWAWGYNGDYGQLGNGSTEDSLSPSPVSGLAGITAISAGLHHALALKADGTVWAWGFNGSGQLGNGSTASSNVPVAVAGLTDVVAIAAGGGSLALKADGTVWAWGSNGFGQLGDGSTVNRTTPVQVSELRSARAIAAGLNFGVALVTRPSPAVTVTPAQLDFGRQIGGLTSAPQSLILSNTGSADLHISKLKPGTLNCLSYALTENQCSNQTIAPGASCRVSVSFTPTELGELNATLDITDDAADSPQSVPLLGTGTRGQADVSITLLATAQGKRSSNLTYTATVRNNGPDIAPTGLTLNLSSSLSFVSVSTSQGACDPPRAGTIDCAIGNLASGGSATVTVLTRIGTPRNDTVSSSASVGLYGDFVGDPDSTNNTATVTTHVYKVQ